MNAATKQFCAGRMCTPSQYDRLKPYARSNAGASLLLRSDCDRLVLDSVESDVWCTTFIVVVVAPPVCKQQ